MWQLIGVLFAATASMVMLSASYVVQDRLTKEASADSFARELARVWFTFGKALGRYAKDNNASLPVGDTIVTCDDLKNAGYLQASFPCVDIFGQELRGLIAKPVGALQSVIVYPATPAQSDLYRRVGARERFGQRAFLFRVAENLKFLAPDYELVAYKSDGSFEELFSRFADTISDYISGASVPALFPSDPEYEYAPLLFVKRAKGVGYWVWSVQETDTGIVFYNQGFSSVCPVSSGLPKKPPTSRWEFNPLPRSERNYSGFITTTIMSTYICIPATQDTVLNNPGASIPSLSVPIDQTFLDAYIENKPDAEGDFVYATSANCGGASFFGALEIRIGSRSYSVFAWQNVCADVQTADGTQYKGGGAIDTMLLFVEGSAPSTWCIDLSQRDLYNYCFNVDSLLSGAGGARSVVTFVE